MSVGLLVTPLLLALLACFCLPTTLQNLQNLWSLQIDFAPSPFHTISGWVRYSLKSSCASVIATTCGLSRGSQALALVIVLGSYKQVLTLILSEFGRDDLAPLIPDAWLPPGV